jgi:oxysterol-binding protein-related protein 3/6/7
MQEVTVRQRSVFTHSVTIDTPGKELCWNFFTRKKNISFGLYKKEEGGRLVGKMTVVSGSMQDVGSTVQTNPYLQITDPIPRYVSTSSINSIGPSSSAIATGSQMTTFKKGRDSKVQVDPPDSTPILSIAHYESARVTIKGSYFVQEPGTYILVFDNSFSVQTPKKLFFFVALRDVEPREIVVQKVLEGWILKKGNRSIQGYQKRWFEVQSSGLMTYYKGPGRTSHGSINLISSAIRLDHDHFLIDIDTEQMTYHFKAEQLGDFQRWTAVFEQFTTQKLGIDFGKQANRAHSGGFNTSSVSFTEFDLAQEKLGTLITTLNTGLGRVRDILDSSSPKMDRRDMQGILLLLSDLSQNLTSTGNHIQEQFHHHQTFSLQQKERNLTTIQTIESAFFACMNDGNRIRKKFGLEIVQANKYLPQMESYSESISLASRQDDEFFDAEGGSDDSEDNFSLHDAVENFTIVDEDSDVCSRSSSVQLLVTEPTPVHPTPPALDKETEEVMPPFVRRTALPAPASSMENISIIGILRNNVGKDLSTGMLQ